MILNNKHDEREKITDDLEENDMNFLLAQQLKECNMKWDKKKKEGLEILRKRLSSIVNDDELHASARL